MKKIITDDHEFEHIIGGKAVSVDKTAPLARLASGRDGTQFFMSRPRRFGHPPDPRERLRRALSARVEKVEPNARPITLVGIKFDSERRDIDIPKIEALERVEIARELHRTKGHATMSTMISKRRDMEVFVR